MAKTRYARAEAEAVAIALRGLLESACERLAIAGSLRRGKPEVGDVELVYVPRVAERVTDLLGGTRRVDLAAVEVDRLLAAGLLRKRRNAAGHEAWGAKNKLAVHVPTGIPVDLFATCEESWWNYLVCRTGPAALNKRIAEAAIAKGWRWNPYGPGFSRGSKAAGNLEVRRMESEQEVFAFVDLPYRSPDRRG